LASLVKKVRSGGVLLNPAKLYPVLNAATRSLSADPGLNSLTRLYDLVSGLQDIPTSRVTFLTVPREPYPYDPNRDQLSQPDASRLFAALRADQPVTVRPEATGIPSSAETTPNATDPNVTTPNVTTPNAITSNVTTPNATTPNAVAPSGTTTAGYTPSAEAGSATPSAPPTFRGTTADHDVCPRHS
jgi:hypothetical protein